MVAFSAIKAGDVLYEVSREKAGNTTMRRQVVRSVHVVEVHDTYALASWNGNTPTKWSAHRFNSLRRTKPNPELSLFERMARASQVQS